MAKCPKCRAEIDELINVQSGTVDYAMTIQKDGTPQYEEKDVNADGVDNDWNCPECDETLFTDEDSAIDFLKSGK